jgi:hypothetical protein
MPNEEIKITKQKIVDWLKEEGFSAEEKTDPKAYFNILTLKGGLGCNIVQDAPHNDSFFIAANIILANEQQALLKKISPQKKEDFVWDLQVNLLKNNELGDFAIKPKPPEDIQAIFISSRRIYYDEFTKGKLLSSINVIMRTMIMTIWMLQRYAGVSIPKMEEKRQDYSM